MPQQLCPRCRYAVTFEDESELVYCGHCGAPQIVLSEELRVAAEQARMAPGDLPPDVAVMHLPPPFPWKSLIRISLLVSAVSIPFVLILPVLAASIAPVALSFFVARNRGVRLSTTIGSRTGLLCGLMSSLGLSIIYTAALVSLRISQPTNNVFDGKLGDTLGAMKAQLLAQPNAEAAQMFEHLVSIPEFRAGGVFAFYAVFLGILVLLAIAGGAFAGFIRSRSVRAR